MKLFDTLKNIWKIEELKTRILTTLGLILVYRLGTDDGANAFEQEHHSNRYTDCRRADPDRKSTRLNSSHNA